MLFRKSHPQKITASKKPEQPHWNAELRELSLGGVVVRRFQRPSPNLERILASFQEEGWPEKIDDPLPSGEFKQSARERIHDAIKKLNRGQKAARIYFYRDGTGQGIVWSLTPRQ